MGRPPGFKRHKPYTTKADGPWCGALRHTRDLNGCKRYCKQPAGYQTDHPGQGRCFVHGGKSRPKRHVGRYDTIKRKSLKEELSRQQLIEQDIMDLAPEVHVLRSLTIDFINRYTTFTKALIRWYRDDGNTKPRKIIDIADAGNLIDKVSKVVERMHKIRSTGSISLDAFKRVTEQMGIIVAKEAGKTFKDQAAVQRFLQTVETQWGTLALDAKTQFAADLEETTDEDDDGPE